MVTTRPFLRGCHLPNLETRMKRECLALGDIQDVYIIVNRLLDGLFNDPEWMEADVQGRVRLLINRYKEVTEQIKGLATEVKHDRS